MVDKPVHKITIMAHKQNRAVKVLERYFLNQVADHLLVMEQEKAWIIDGDYDTFRRMKIAAAEISDEDQSTKTRRTAKSADDERREPPRWRFPFRKVADLEREIAACEARIAEIHQQMAQPDILRDGIVVKQLKVQLNDVQEQVRLLYEHWEESLQRNTK
jgi:ATP-binding cassette subfamily F protein 3